MSRIFPLLGLVLLAPCALFAETITSGELYAFTDGSTYAFPSTISGSNFAIVGYVPLQIPTPGSTTNCSYISGGSCTFDFTQSTVEGSSFAFSSLLYNGVTYPLSAPNRFEIAWTISSSVATTLFNSTSTSPGFGSFYWSNVPFTASGTLTYFSNNVASLTIPLNGSGLAEGGFGVNNFSFTSGSVSYVFTSAAVPEPSTGALTLGAVIMISAIARRRRHQ